MKAYFGRRYVFSASHRLHSHEFTSEQNRAVYGKCSNPHGHGHNYVLEVLVRGAVAEETGMVINLADLDAVIRTQVLGRFDHANLNLDPLFTSQVPTTENLCKAVFALLRDAIPAGVALEYVRVEETENNFFQYFGDGSAEAA
jgi:6-pyruvoyltetrahydropterin/6-carboxytetrahydropterin synthase